MISDKFVTFMIDQSDIWSVSYIVLLMFGIYLGPLANIFGWFLTEQVHKYTQGFKMKSKQR